LHIATAKDSTQMSAGIRDTSETDIVIERPDGRKRLYWIVGVTGIAVVAIVMLLYPLVSRWSQAEISVPLARLRLAVVTRGDFVRDVGVQGTIVAAVSPTLFAVADGTVTLEIKAGDTVSAGDILARVQSPNLTNQLQQEQATLDGLQT
jgi:HlyD family secretion protein